MFPVLSVPAALASLKHDCEVAVFITPLSCASSLRPAKTLPTSRLILSAPSAQLQVEDHVYISPL
jgi:hypothetical protein